MLPLAISLWVNLVFSQKAQNKIKIEQDIVLNNSMWVESNRNIEIRKHGGIGFFYPYNLPDANREALALFRTNSIPINTGFAIIEIDDAIKNLKTLKGRIKFSGSDIDQTQDTLIITAFYSKAKDSLVLKNLHKGHISDAATMVKISKPLAQFESFQINLPESNTTKEQKYLIIQLLIKSGSDDDFYYGISNAIIDDFRLVSTKE
jgi:hypothetical protein